MHFSLIILIWKSDESEPKNWEFCQEDVEHAVDVRVFVDIDFDVDVDVDTNRSIDG